MLKTKRFFQDLCQEYTKSLSDFKGWVCARAEWVVKQNSQRESQKADIGSLEGCFEENLKDFSINNRALRVKNRFPPFVSRIGR